MKLMIEIPEEFYEAVKKDPSILAPPFLSCEKVGEIIANGIPLPKGHGDLIDRNNLLEYMDINICAYTPAINRYEIITAPTIIEADKGE